MVSVGATTPRGGTGTRGKNPPQGGAAHGARAHHRGAHNTAGGPQGGTTPRGAPAHRGSLPPANNWFRINFGGLTPAVLFQVAEVGGCDSSKIWHLRAGSPASNL